MDMEILINTTIVYRSDTQIPLLLQHRDILHVRATALL